MHTTQTTDLTEVMRINDPSTEFRSATATILSSYTSTSLGDMFDDVRVNGLYSYVGGPVPSDVTEQANLLGEWEMTSSILVKYIRRN